MQRSDETDPLYELYLPLTYNNGRQIEAEKFDLTRRELVDRFDGLTSTPPGFPLQGWWRAAGTVVRDNIVIWTVLTQGDENGFFRNYKEVLKQRLDQKEILIIKIPAEAL
jgi:hypothetical protein